MLHEQRTEFDVCVLVPSVKSGINVFYLIIYQFFNKSIVIYNQEDE